MPTANNNKFQVVAQVKTTSVQANVKVNNITSVARASGVQGDDGAPGVGVPTGGTTGQILSKINSSDYNTQWVDQSSSSAVTSVNGKTGVVTIDKTDVGLPNVDNTSDANKPVSTATQTALNAKYDASNPSNYVNAAGASAAAPVQSVAGKTGTVTLIKSDVGLSNVDNTSDTNKPVSTAQASEDNLRVLKAGDTMTGMLTLQPTVAQPGGSVRVVQQTNTAANGVRVVNSGQSAAGGFGWSSATNMSLQSDANLTLTAGTGSNIFLSPAGTGIALGTSTLAPTHTLTLPSTATGIAAYNTTDQTTNYERFRMFWQGDAFNLIPESGGTGTRRDVIIGPFSALRFYASDSNVNGYMNFSRNASSANSKIINLVGSYLSNGGVQYGIALQPVINQSATAGYTALLINPTETTVGTGAKNLIDAQVGGASKFKVENGGAITTASLAGGGTQMVVADNNGLLGMQAIPSGGGSGSGITRSILSISTNTTAGATTLIDYVYFVSAGATLTLPTAVGNTNEYKVINSGAVDITVNTTSSQTINGNTSMIISPNSSRIFLSNNTSWGVF